MSPDGITLTTNTVSATLAQYGQFVATSDELQLIAINDTMEDSAELLGYAGALSLDSLIRNELDGNLTQVYADAASNSSKANVESGTDTLSSVDLKVSLKTLRAANVPTLEDGLYRMIVHPIMEYGILAETGAADFVVLNRYQQNNKGGIVSEKGEIGTAFGIKLMRSSNIRADTTSTNTYGNILLGKDAYGTIDIQNAGLKMIVKPLGSAGTEDPLSQRGTVGYKMFFVAKVLEAARGHAVWAYGV